MREHIVGVDDMGEPAFRREPPAKVAVEDLDQRRLRSITGRGNLDELMKDMDISLDLEVANHINPEKGDFNLNLPITSMKSFTPDEVAKNVPAVKSLMLLKTLLLEMQSNIDNRRDIRKLILEVSGNQPAADVVPVADDEPDNGPVDCLKGERDRRLFSDPYFPELDK